MTTLFPRITPLGTVANVISGFAFKSSEFGQLGIPVIKIKNIQLGEVDLANIQCVSEQYLSIDSKYHVHKGDILISLTGSHINQPNSVVGRVARYNKGFPKALLNQRVGKVIIRRLEKCYGGFLYYHLFDENIRREIASCAHGAANQANVSPTQIEKLSIYLPPISTQYKIASILSSYDDLIENNKRRINIQEEMAQTIYDEWFVKFRFPGHENVKMVESELGMIPKGWEVGRLDDVLVLQRGFDLPTNKRKEGNIPIYASTGVVGTHDMSKVNYPSVVTGRSGSIGTVMYVEENFWPLNTTLWGKKFQRSTPLYAYYLLKSINLNSFSSGAAVPTLNRNHIHSLNVVMPPNDVIEHFTEYVKPFFTLNSKLNEKNINLKATRDLLLPRLISGEIDVSELDIDVGGITE